MNTGKIAGNVATAFFVLLLLIASLVILAPFAGWHVNTVLSGSMEPAIATGGMVIVGPAATEAIQAGDVIVFSRGGAEVCHRVVSVEEGPSPRFFTKGDANGAADTVPITPSQVTGKVVASFPLVGYFIHFAKTPAGLSLTILFPLLFLIGTELKGLLSDKGKKDDGPGGRE